MIPKERKETIRGYGKAELLVAGGLLILYLIFIATFGHWIWGKYIGEGFYVQCAYWILVVYLGWLLFNSFVFYIQEDEIIYCVNNLTGEVRLKNGPGWDIYVPLVFTVGRISLKWKGLAENQYIEVAVPTLESEAKIVLTYSFKPIATNWELIYTYILKGERVPAEISAFVGEVFSIVASRIRLEDIITVLKPRIIRLIESRLTEGFLLSMNLEAEFLSEEFERFKEKLKELIERYKEIKREEEEKKVKEEKARVTREEIVETVSRIKEIHTRLDEILRELYKFLTKESVLVKVEGSLKEFSPEEEETLRDLASTYLFLSQVHTQMEEAEERLKPDGEIGKQLKSLGIEVGFPFREEVGLGRLTSVFGELGLFIKDSEMELIPERASKRFSEKFLERMRFSPFELDHGVILRVRIRNIRPSNEVELARDQKAQMIYEVEKEKLRRDFQVDTVETLGKVGISPSEANESALLLLGAEEGKINKISFPGFSGKDLQVLKDLLKAVRGR